MCDCAPCQVRRPLFPCDRCNGSFCAAHSFYPDHDCASRRSTSTSTSTSTFVSGFGPAHKPAAAMSGQPLQAFDTPIDIEDDAEDEADVIVPIGTMPGVTAPLQPVLSLTSTQLAGIVSHASLWPPVQATPSIPLRCNDVEMASEAEPTVAVSFSVSHSTFDPAEQSLTWMAGGTNPGDDGQPRFPISYCHLINEFLCPMSVRIGQGLGGHTFQAARLNVTRGSYLAGVHARSAVDPLCAAARDGVASAVLRLDAQVLSIMPHLAALLFRRSVDMHNLSHPGDDRAQAIRETFRLNKPMGEATPDALVTVDLEKSVVSIPFDIPCGVQVDESEGAVEFNLDIQWGRLNPQHRAHLLSVLVGADLSRLAISGLGAGPLSTCTRNVEHCFADYFPIARGGIFLESILVPCVMAAMQRASAKAVVLAAQEAIRVNITTANNWSEPCENEESQPFQWALARALGKIKEDHPLATPMLFLRQLKDDALICDNAELKAKLFLQAGIGHCREFSEVSFHVLTQLARADPTFASLLGPMVRAEYGDQDHAFVVGGVPVRAVADYQPDQEDEDEGEDDGEEGSNETDDPPIAQWDVAADLLQSGVEGWVCDPYLEAADYRETLKGKHATYLSERSAEDAADAVPEHLQDDVAAQVSDDDVLLADAPTALMLLRERFPDPL